MALLAGPLSIIPGSATGAPPPWVRPVGPTLPSPPSLVPAPAPAKHEGVVATAGTARAGAAVLPRSHSVGRGGTKVSAPAPKKTGAMKKASDVQPPQAPLRSAAAPRTLMSAEEAIDAVAMDDVQQLLEESPTRFVLVL